MVRQVIRPCLAAVAVIAIAFGTALSPVGAADGNYSVGVAKVDITPDYPIRLNGFGFRRTESEGVTQRIWAKALAIGTDNEKPLILITIDSLGLRLPMIEEVAKRLKSKAGIERDRLAVMFTHCHTTPKLNGASDTVFSVPIPPEHQAHIDRYDGEITDALEKVALAALADRKPAKLGWAVGKVGFAKNRRTPGGPVDHRLPMLVVKSADNGAVRAVYVTYACHCVTLSNNKISGDWAGFAAEAIQRDNPGAIALVSIGCGSDSNPNSDSVGGNVAVVSEQGAEIAHEVQRLQKLPLQQIVGPISTTLKHIELPLKALPSRAELHAVAAHNTPEGYNAKYQLAKLDRGEPLQAAIDYPIQTWAFGDSLAMVFLAGEVCVDYSIRLRQEFDSAHLWINGYSNDFCCYVPSERLLREGGYGGGAETVYFGLPATLRTGVEDKIIDEVRRQLPARFQNKASSRNAPGESLSPAKSGQASSSANPRRSVPTGSPAKAAQAVDSPDANSGDAASAILEIVKQTKVGTPDEYAHIPRIWEISIAAGRRNNPAEVTRVLAIAIPNADQPMQHWQAVAIGGGIINGLSQANCSPRIRIRELVEGKPTLLACWERTIQLAKAMADDETVRVGTRYDALRLLSADTFERAGPHLIKYLRSDDGELAMGAISSLADIESPAALDALVTAFPVYSQPSQALAIKLLLRNDARTAALLGAIEKGTISSNALSMEQWSALKKTKNQELRARIAALQIPASKQEGGPPSAD